jgi:hypothetical protein
MNDHGDVRDLFEPPPVRKLRPGWIRAVRLVALVLCPICAFTAFAGIITFTFVGLPIGIFISLIWGLLAAGLAHLAWRLYR